MPRVKKYNRKLHKEKLWNTDFLIMQEIPEEKEHESVHVSSPRSNRPSFNSIKENIMNLKRQNKDQTCIIKNLKEQIKSQQEYSMDLLARYDQCFDLTVTLRTRINVLETAEYSHKDAGDGSDEAENSTDPDQMRKDIDKLERKWKSWKVRATVLNLDNGILKQELADLKEKVKQYELEYQKIQASKSHSNCREGFQSDKVLNDSLLSQWGASNENRTNELPGQSIMENTGIDTNCGRNKDLSGQRTTNKLVQLLSKRSRAMKEGINNYQSSNDANGTPPAPPTKRLQLPGIVQKRPPTEQPASVKLSKSISVIDLKFLSKYSLCPDGEDFSLQTCRSQTFRPFVGHRRSS